MGAKSKWEQVTADVSRNMITFRVTNAICKWLAFALVIGHLFLPFAMAGGMGPWTAISSLSFFHDMVGWPLGILFTSGVLLAVGATLFRPFLSGSAFERFNRGLFWIEAFGIISLMLILVLVVNISPMTGSLVLLLAFVFTLLSFGKEAKC